MARSPVYTRTWRKIYFEALSNQAAGIMIISSIVFTFAPQDADRAEAILRELRDASLKEAGVVRFEVGRSRDKPNVFALWEVYRDQDAVNAHRGTEHFQRLVVDCIRPLAQQRTVETVTPI